MQADAFVEELHDVKRDVRRVFRLEQLERLKAELAILGPGFHQEDQTVRTIQIHHTDVPDPTFVIR